MEYFMVSFVILAASVAIMEAASLLKKRRWGENP